MRPEGVTGLACKAAEVRIVDNYRGEVGDAGHDGGYKAPCEVRATSSCGLVHDRAHSIGTVNGPDKKGQASRWYDVRLDGEEMANLVDGEPDCWEGERPEDEEGDELSSCYAANRNAYWHFVV